MRALLSRLKPGPGAFELATAAAMTLFCSYQFGASASGGQHRYAEIAFIAFIGCVCWQRSIFKRRAGREVTKAVTAFVEASNRAREYHRSLVCADCA